MNILFLGDVVGKAGREAVRNSYSYLITEYKIDFSIVNGENATHGFGISADHCRDFLDLGINVITLGNHAFDKSSVKEFINQDNRILRPYNFIIDDVAGHFGIYDCKGYKVMVINVIGEIFMKAKIAITSPFKAMEQLVKEYKLKENVDIIIVDFHAETTSEKNALGFFLDGKISAIFGTHTHIPTADSRILPQGTGYKTDVGMCGDYQSVIGMNIEKAIAKMLGENKGYLEPAEAKATVKGVVVVIDENSGLCSDIKDISI